jgi:hypothetical protein
MDLLMSWRIALTLGSESGHTGALALPVSTQKMFLMGAAARSLRSGTDLGLAGDSGSRCRLRFLLAGQVVLRGRSAIFCTRIAALTLIEGSGVDTGSSTLRYQEGGEYCATCRQPGG